jgi:ATP-binding cassette subfamily B protein
MKATWRNLRGIASRRRPRALGTRHSALRTRSWVILGRYLRPQRRRALGLGLLLVGGVGLQLVNPQILRSFIDRAMAGEAFGRLLGMAALFIGVAMISQVVTVAATYLSARVGWTATNLLRSDLALHCLRLDMPFHNARTPGEMIERIDGDVTALTNFFTQFVLRVLGSGLLLSGVLILLFREDPRVGAALTVYAAAALAVISRCRNLAVPRMAAERQAIAELFGFIEERLAGIDDIRANGGGGHVMRGFHDSMRNLFNQGRRAALTSAGLRVITVGLFVLGYALALGMGAWLYRAGTITIGTVYLLFQYTDMLRRPLEQIGEQLREFQRAAAGIARVNDLFDAAPAIVDGHDAELPGGPLSVEFDAVSFAYGPDEHVVKDVSFSLHPGEVLGLLGRTGSGKTTLARLLGRLYDPGTGAVRLGGVDIRRVRLAGLRRRIGVVTQDVQLFQATIRDNLTFFDASVTDERIHAVLKGLGLSGWLRSQPAGLDTELASGGGGLSAGEAQLLAFARVFLQDPGLVILDEASSRLDPATEQLIERAIDTLLAGRTGIIIAHRLSTVQRADRILILDQGRIDEQGERLVLAGNPGSHFARLLRTGLEEVLA